MAELAGFKYYANVPWKKTNFVANTGRKSKNTESIMMFTKGKARALRIDAKKEKDYWGKHVVLDYNREGIDLKIAVPIEKQYEIETAIQEMFEEHRNPDTIFSELESMGYPIRNMNDWDGHIYMSGAKGMLPTEFKVAPVNKKDKIHQSEKPTELLEQIINYVTLPHEKILDQFAGSGVTGEAALNTKRDSILIEKNEETFEKAAQRLRRKCR